jgi:hypothetical protein
MKFVHLESSAKMLWRACRQVADVRQEPVLVGLDCEMCATQDDDRELLGLCLVDADGEVLVQVGCWVLGAALALSVWPAAVRCKLREAGRQHIPGHSRQCRMEQ